MEFITQHKLLAGVVLVVLLFGGWYFLAPSESGSSAIITTSDGQPLSPSQAAGVSVADKGTQQLLNTLLTLRTVKLDGNIFSEPAFATLQDFSTQIVPEPVGRPDPFAPLTTVRTAGSASATRSAQIFTPGR